MKTINEVTLLGNVARDPEVRTLSNGTKVARFTIATSEGGYKTREGKDIPEKTQFHHITAWAGKADVVEKLLHKGDSVFLKGRIEYNEGTNKDGVKMQYTEIIAEDFSLCHSRNGAAASQQQNAAPQGAYQPQGYAPQQGYQQPQYAPQGAYQPQGFRQQPQQPQYAQPYQQPNPYQPQQNAPF